TPEVAGSSPVAPAVEVPAIAAYLIGCGDLWSRSVAPLGMSSSALAHAVRQVRERQFGAEPRVGERADDQRVTPRCQVGRRPVDARRIVGLEYDFGCQTKLDVGPAGRLPASSEME